MYRHQRLVHTAGRVYMPPDDTWVHANVSKSDVVANGPLPSDGDAATNVLITTQILLANTAVTAAAAAGNQRGGEVNVAVDVQIVDTAAGGSGAVVATATTAAPIAIGAGENQTVTLTVVTPPSNTGDTTNSSDSVNTMVQLWSVARPYLYTAVVTISTVTVTVASADSGISHGEAAAALRVVIDTQNISFGVRKIELDPDRGMLLNNRKVKVRGKGERSSY